MSIHRNHTLRLDKMQKRKFCVHVLYFIYKYIYNIGKKEPKNTPFNISY